MTLLARWIGLERVIGLMMLAVFVALRSWDPAPLEAFRLQVFDYYQLIKPRQPTAYPAMIVDIDEKSLSQIGQWPWPRDTIAKLVDQIAAQGAKAVAFDVIFAEPRALIGFAGPRTIKATIRIELPRGFQTSEFLLEHGFIDRIVPRDKLKTEIARTIDYCGK